MESGQGKVFGWLDYTVFGGMLLVSSAIGVYHSSKGQHSASDVLVGGKNMGILPVAASIMATFMSAAGLLGIPAEHWLFGSQLVLSNTFLVIPTITVLGTHLILPVFYHLGCLSANEYLERRFSHSLRAFACLVYCLTTTFGIGITLYAPAMALTQGLGAWITIWTTGLVCTFYTTIGGLRAVVWTDTFQTVVMFGALVWIVVKGLGDAGGMGQVWTDNWHTQRLVFSELDPSPYVRISFWNVVIGGTMAHLMAYFTNQSTIQRFNSLPTLSDAKKTMWSASPLFMLVNLICLLLGMIIVSRYKGCDPIKTRRIQAADQLFPLFVMDTMSAVAGVPGMFVACMFSASLSSASSGINSLTAVVLEDLVRPYVWPNMSQLQTLRLLKVLAIAFGLLAIGAANVARHFGNIIQAAMTVFGLFGAPMCGVFLLGLLIPCATNKGAIGGLVCGLAFNLWMGLGAFVYPSYQMTKELNYVDSCPETYFAANGRQFNLTMHEATRKLQIEQNEEIFPIYRISFMYFMFTGVSIVIVVGTVVSLFSASAADLDKVDTTLLIPLIGDQLKKRRRRHPQNMSTSTKDNVSTELHTITNNHVDLCVVDEPNL